MRSHFDLQEEAAECGLACLAAVCTVHGAGLSLSELRARFAASLRGSSLERLIEVAGVLGFRTRALRIEAGDLSAVPVPAILHWDLEHYVVLLGGTRKGFRIFDPASGVRDVNAQEADERFTGVVLELDATDRLARRRPAVDIADVGRRVLRELARPLLMLLAFTAALQAALFAGPVFIKWMLDEATQIGSKPVIWQVGAAFAALVLLQVFAYVIRGWSSLVLSSRLANQWVAHVVDHLFRLPIGYFEKRHLGDLMTRVEAVHVLRRFAVGSTIEAIIDGVFAVIAAAFLIAYGGVLAWITLVAVAVYWAVRVASVRPLREATEDHVRADAKQLSYLVESIRGIRTIKLNDRMEQRLGALSILLGEATGKEARKGLIDLFTGAAHRVVFGAEQVAVVAIGCIAIADTRMSIGAFVAFLAVRQMLTERSADLADKYAEGRALMAHYGRVRDLLVAVPEKDGPIALPRSGAKGCVELRDVWFRYDEGQPWVLRGCNLKIDPGESVAISAPSGGGKSTLLKIMLGVLEPTRGEVLIDGVPLAQLRRRDFLELIGAVLQDDVAFSGTVAENIAFSPFGFDARDVEQAARAAAIHDDIMAMTMGYSTLVGDMGSSLSGGQKQRLILARALHRAPRILFMDEATSHLDAGREQSIMHAVSHLDITRIIVAHREETLRLAGRVVELAGGTLAAANVSPRHVPVELLPT